MISYEQYCQIKEALAKGLSRRQIASSLGIDPGTVNDWARKGRYEARKPAPRASKLDGYRARIAALLEQHPYSVQQLFSRLKQEGYAGAYSILRDHVAKVRPKRMEAYLKVNYAPGECAQIDWGSYGSVRVGGTRRALSFFALVLCHSRYLYLEFTLGQSMEWFLGCQQRAFLKMGAVPRVMIVDNCKTAVLSHPVGGPVVYNPHYLDFARHYGFEVRACGPRHPQSKGIVEKAVGYIKSNLLNGLQIGDFASLEPQARLWLDQVANVRTHSETKRRPVDLFSEEKPLMLPLNASPYETVLTKTVSSCRRCRVRVDGNQYTVPSSLARRPLTLQLSSQSLRLFHGAELVAEHPRCFDRGKDFEKPDHVRDLLDQRRQAARERTLARFLALSPVAAQYRAGLLERRLNASHHIERIVALGQIHGEEAVARALADACELGAFSSEYITNLIEQRKRTRPEPGALHLTRASDMLELELPPPDLSAYDTL